MNGIKSYPLPILFYDSDCPLCVRFKQALDRLDPMNTVTKIPIQDEEVFEFFPELNKENCHAELHLIDEYGNIHRGSDVPRYLIEKYPGVNKFAWLADTNVGRKAVDLFYNAASRTRESLLNRCPKCKKSRKEKCI